MPLPYRFTFFFVFLLLFLAFIQGVSHTPNIAQAEALASREAIINAEISTATQMMMLAEATSYDCSGQTAVSVAECQALVAIYNDNPNAILSNWLVAGSSPCSWSGVTCQDGGVTYLSLSSGNQLTSVPAEIGQLSNLQGLYLIGNQLTSVPTEIGQLSNLQELFLGHNQLMTVPAEIGQLNNLLLLDLYNIQLTAVPAEIGQLSNLQTLRLEGNQLMVVPTEIGQLSNLQELSLGHNQLTTVPAEIGQLSNLQSLGLSSNQLTVVPAEIGQLNNLLLLDLSSNQLTAVPVEIGLLSNLNQLDLNHNQLASVPLSIGQLSNLQELRLYNNQLTSMPAEIGQLNNLHWLDLSHNQLTTVPVEIGLLSNLNQLDLNHNQLTSVPLSIGQLSNLQMLNLHWNQLTSLPVEMWQLSNLQRLDLGGNQLTVLPAEIRQLSNLQQLELGGNQLTAVPAEIGQLSNLQWLYLWVNQLTVVPAEIGQLSNLKTLRLDNNQLTAVPAEIGQLSNLLSLTLGGNQLTTVPAEIGQLSNLQALTLGGNQLTTVLAEIGQLNHLQELHLNDNPQLAGPIPTDFTNLPLNYFHFSNTQICEPTDSVMQNWLASIQNLFSTGIECGGDGLADDINAFVGTGRQQLMQASDDAYDVSQVGDYFLDKLEVDAVNLVIDTTLNLWSLSSIDWGLVGQGMNHITTPGYQAALNASWNGWVSDSAAKHWYKPLYDNIHNNRQLLFNESAQAGFKYYAQEAGIEVAKDSIKKWLVDEFVPSADNPILNNFGAPANDLAFEYRVELTREGAEVQALLPTLGLTPAQEEAYRADMLARQQAHTQMMAQLNSHRDLLWNSYQDAQASENNWWNFWGKFLLKYAVIGGATLAWDGPGFYVASAGTTAVDTIYTAVQGTRALAHDQKMIDQSLRFVGSRIPHTYAQISLNTVAGLNLIRSGQPPKIADGQIMLATMHSTGHYRVWPGLWWAEESSEIKVQIRNNANFPTTFMTSASYDHTGFWSGSQRLLPEGEGRTVNQFMQGIATIPLKMRDDGLSPNDGGFVDILVLGATETGLYPVDTLSIAWNPIQIETMADSIKRSMAGYTLAELNSAPTHPYPLSSAVINLPNSTEYRMVLGVTNPFTLTIAASLTQIIPSEFTVLDSDGATIVGDSLVWTTVISPEVGLEFRPLLQWEGTPDSTVVIPAAHLAFEDIDTGLGDTYDGVEETVQAPWPLELTADIPLTWSQNSTITGTVSLTNITDSLTTTGILTVTAKTPEGHTLWNMTTPITVSPGQTEMISLPFKSTQSGYAIVEGELAIAGVEKPVFAEIVLVTGGGTTYLPLVVRP